MGDSLAQKAENSGHLSYVARFSEIASSLIQILEHYFYYTQGFYRPVTSVLGGASESSKLLASASMGVEVGNYILSTFEC